MFNPWMSQNFGKNIMNMQQQNMMNSMMNQNNFQMGQMGQIDQMNPLMNTQMMNQINPMMQQQQMTQLYMMQQTNLAKQSPNISNNINFGKEVQSNQAANSSFSALNSQPQRKPLSVIFRANSARKIKTPICVSCMLEDKVSSIIDKYREKSGDKAPNIKFYFNAKNLDTRLSVSEVGLTNNANIFVLETGLVQNKNNEEKEKKDNIEEREGDKKVKKDDEDEKEDNKKEKKKLENIDNNADY
jgi:hypothetical protein